MAAAGALVFLLFSGGDPYQPPAAPTPTSSPADITDFLPTASPLPGTISPAQLDDSGRSSWASWLTAM
jgi:hypothetical protein